MNLFSELDLYILALVMNVLRMVKLFAWEDKVKAQIGEKREGIT